MVVKLTNTILPARLLALFPMLTKCLRDREQLFFIIMLGERTFQVEAFLEEPSLGRFGDPTLDHINFLYSYSTISIPRLQTSCLFIVSLMCSVYCFLEIELTKQSVS